MQNCPVISSAIYQMLHCGGKSVSEHGQVWQVRGACASTFSFLFPVLPVERHESRILFFLGQDTDSGLQLISGLQRGRELLGF